MQSQCADARSWPLWWEWLRVLGIAFLIMTPGTMACVRYMELWGVFSKLANAYMISILLCGLATAVWVGARVLGLAGALSLLVPARLAGLKALALLLASGFLLARLAMLRPVLGTVGTVVVGTLPMAPAMVAPGLATAMLIAHLLACRATSQPVKT